jgi:hypothetical protein
MCSPMLIGGTMGAVSTFMQQQDAEAQAEQQYLNNKAAIERSNESARANANLQWANQRLESAKDAAMISEEREAIAREALIERSKIIAASAEGGVGGVSLTRSFVSSEIGEGSAESSVALEEGFNQQQAKLKEEATLAQLSSNLQALPSKPKKMSFLGRTLGIASGALSGATTAQSLVKTFGSKNNKVPKLKAPSGRTGISIQPIVRPSTSNIA